VRREINLSGGEITLLKTMGLSGTSTPGKQLVKSIGEMETRVSRCAEWLISVGYVLSNKASIRSMEDVERTFFRVNASYARDLRDAIRPSRRANRIGRAPPPPRLNFAR